VDLINLAVDPEKELDGAECWPWEDDTMLIVARYNNPKFRNMQARLMEPYIRKMGRKGVTTEQAEAILVRCMAKTLLLGWDNLSLEGEEVEYTPEKALELLQDARLADFKEIVMLESQNMENYRLEALEEDLGNSETSLDTTADGQ
jgi:hypothetical protein